MRIARGTALLLWGVLFMSGHGQACGDGIGSDNVSENPKSFIQAGEKGYIVVRTSVTIEGITEGCEVVEGAPKRKVKRYKKRACAAIAKFQYKPATDENGLPKRSDGLEYRFGFEF